MLQRLSGQCLGLTLQGCGFSSKACGEYVEAACPSSVCVELFWFPIVQKPEARLIGVYKLPLAYVLQ